MNIYEFADAIGVSIGTVSRAVNGRKGVSPATRDMVLRRMKELGYKPSLAAVSLASGRSSTVALWTPGVRSSYVAELLKWLELELELHDCDLAVIDVERKREDIERLAALLQWPVDGVFVLDGMGWLDELAARYRLSLPVVSIGPHSSTTCDFVSLTLADAVRQAIRHLAQQGCHRIAYFVPVEYDHPDDSRWRAYTDEMVALGFEPVRVRIRQYYGNRAAAIQSLREYLRDQPCPDGIFCFNDEIALSVYRSLLDLGIRVPDQVLLAGCDGIEETRYLERPLATIEFPLQEMCRLAWQFLQTRLDEPEHPRQEATLPAVWVPRASALRPLHVGAGNGTP